MGQQERESKQRAKRANLRKLILKSIATAGLLNMAILVPNVVGAMIKLGMLPNRRQKEFVESSRKRLMRQGLIAYKDGMLRLTQTGERALRVLELREYGTYKPLRWDGKWRVLIFDIPEHRKGTREKIRRTLIAIGFERLQDSVWVYPYDCEDLLTLLKADFHIRRDLLYLIVDSIENDKHLKHVFKL